MMKKLLFLLLLILIANIIIYDIPQDKVEPVFNENPISESSGTKSYTLDLNNLNITTKNLKSFLNNIYTKNIIVYPKINVMYKSKLEGKINGYQFINNDINLDIIKFSNYYINLLKKNGIYSDIEDITINGLGIERITLNLSIDQINQLKERYNKLIYD